MVQREVRDFLRTHEQRRRLLPRALLVGLAASRRSLSRALDGGGRARERLIVRDTESYWATATGAGRLARCRCRRLARATLRPGSLRKRDSTPQGGSPLRACEWLRILAVKFVGGVAGIGSGPGPRSRGPDDSDGRALGQMVSRWFSCTARERQTLIAAGAGAGLAAAFNAPLSGLVFVLEEVQRDFSPTVFTATFIAAVTADIVARL